MNWATTDTTDLDSYDLDKALFNGFKIFHNTIGYLDEEESKTSQHDPMICNVEVFNNKCVKVRFLDNGRHDTQTAVCSDNDVFDLDMGIMICVAKHYANGSAQLYKTIREAKKYYQRYQRFDENVKELLKNQEKRKAKWEAYKKRKAEKKRQEQIDIQKEAYLAAMKEMNKND